MTFTVEHQGMDKPTSGGCKSAHARVAQETKSNAPAKKGPVAGQKTKAPGRKGIQDAPIC